LMFSANRCSFTLCAPPGVETKKRDDVVLKGEEHSSGCDDGFKRKN